MSEEKLYAVKNDEGLLLSYSEQGDPLWRVWGEMFADKPTAEITARAENSHVVTLIEAPAKVVVSEVEAATLKNGKMNKFPAWYLGINTPNEDQDRLMRAYVNGYTVAKEKKYLVELDGLVTTDGAKQYLTNKEGKWFACRRMSGLNQEFTDKELNAAPEWAKQLNREEVTYDE